MSRVRVSVADPNWFNVRNSPLFDQIESTKVFDLLKSAATVRRLQKRAELFHGGERPATVVARA
jgi:hypothetical protein